MASTTMYIYEENTGKIKYTVNDVAPQHVDNFQKKGIPFLAVRSICDTTDQNLPDFIATNIENKKKLNILKILELIVKKPYELKKFPKLIMNYRKSMNGLREIFRNFTL